MLGLSSLLPPPRRRPSSLPTTELKPTQCPSPLLRDVGPPPLRSMEEYAKGKEDTKGGPMKWEAQAVRHKDEPRLLSWLVLALSFSLVTADHLPSPMATRTPAKGQTTARWAEQQHPRSNDNTAGQSTSQHANRRYGTPIDEPAGQSTPQNANQ